jgi:hypothetical protein
MYAAAIWIYLRVTRAKDRIGKWGLLSYVLIVAAAYVADILSPPPPSVRPMLITVIPFTWLLILWAWWVDRHREARI